MSDNKELALAALEKINDRAKEEIGKISDAVEAARKANASWDDIGKALKVSRQAAWEKYRKVIINHGSPPPGF